MIVKIPEDELVRYQIDKIAKQVAREGFHFEEEIKRMALKRKRLDCDVLYKVFS